MKRSEAWPEWMKWYPEDYTPIGGRWNPRWEEWIKEHPEYKENEPPNTYGYAGAKRRGN